MLDTILTFVPPWALFFSAVFTVLAGVVKGAVGFAMPMIMISGMASVLPAEIAIAGLILPTVATNTWQALRQGWRAALAATMRFRLYFGLVLVFIVFGAQLVPVMPGWLLFLCLGVPITVLAALQLGGYRFKINDGNRRRVEIGVGVFAGTLGGLSGTWGPPTVLYLTALNVAKQEAVRVQGVIYGVGAVVLMLAHLRSGLFNWETAQFSALLLIPGAIGMTVGLWLQDKLDQARFRQITLIVLVIAGLNLIRRGLMG